MLYNDTTMTIGEHFGELRRRLIRALLGVGVGAGVCLLLRKQLFRILIWPMAVATSGQSLPLDYLSPPEAFATLLRVCVIIGAILACPYGLYQMWMFISAGLYNRERKAVRVYFVPAIVLFLLGVAFFFVVVAPLVLQFFLRFAQQNFPEMPNWGVGWLGEHLFGGRRVELAARPVDPGGIVRPRWTLQYYTGFISTMSLVFGVAFQTPLVVMFLGRTGMVSQKSMRRSRPYVVLVILILAAFITPPDVISQLALAGPMYLLFEIGLLFARRRKER